MRSWGVSPPSGSSWAVRALMEEGRGVRHLRHAEDLLEAMARMLALPIEQVMFGFASYPRE